ncbi:MAG: UDP-N-acetylmuramoyl-tripeptide--D-alanyl-D-alanine ligase [Candidatus Bacteroides intestinipullorum]|uniref:UDP-N-acetylmuramoyl-tripeptide--D-alanyl-D-alanine ligase n=1 Tax=Candidatus Bacteroides intestinipullorum TaxID=2838471 RepID=A0A9E2NNY9_9BACE|nr:UDP-N-acetylmuramoyl-tripeptide--D-alanyl-D-alanine ligase [Candidatus Bacteroides intestinipullorum]
MTDLTTLYRIFLQSTGVTTDSRRCPAGSLFIALRGETFDGNAFAAQALKDGCACAVVDNPQYLPEGDPRYLLVDDCLKTLQQLARHHRRALGTPVIGITGTNGKTTTKELMAAVLSQQYQLHYTQGNLNNHIGVPLTLLELRPEHQLAVIEMGASHPGDIRELVDIAEPDYGLITNVGRAHLEGFGSFEGVIRTKGELFDYLREKGGATVFVHDDNPYLKDMAHDLKQVCYGSQAGLYVCGRMTGNSPYLALAWHTEGEAEEHPVQTHLIGEYNLPNALAAITVGRYFNVPAGQICHALESYVPHNNRSQLVRTADNTLIVDAYNANPTSMKAAIDNFHKMQAAHKMLILGDMRELGTDSPALHQEVVDQLETYGFEDVVLVGTAFAATRHHYPTYPDAPALIANLQAHHPTGKTILIKGSNGLHLNTVAEALK